MKSPHTKRYDFHQNDKTLTRKHVAERNRRARINYYLHEIEKLISPSVIQSSASTKLEKAEVLERTVAYLKQHRVSQMNVHQNYIRGFLECIRSIQALMLTMKVSESDVRHVFHGCLASVKNGFQNRCQELSTTIAVNRNSIENGRLQDLEEESTKVKAKTARVPLGEISGNVIDSVGPSSSSSSSTSLLPSTRENCGSDCEMSDDENAIDLSLTKRRGSVKNSRSNDDSSETSVSENDSDDDSMWRPW